MHINFLEGRSFFADTMKEIMMRSGFVIWRDLNPKRANVLIEDKRGADAEGKACDDESD